MDVTLFNTIKALIATYNPGNTAAPSLLPNSLIAALFSAGAWDPAANVPHLQSGQGVPGAAFKASGAGTTVLDGIGTWALNDYAIFSPQNAKWLRIVGATGQVLGGTSGEQLTAADIEAALGANVATKTGQHTMLSASDTIVSGLSLVAGVIACMDSDPILTFLNVTAKKGDQAGTPAAGSFFLKGWMPTDSTHPAPVAATGYAGIVCSWIAFGTL